MKTNAYGYLAEVAALPIVPAICFSSSSSDGSVLLDQRVLGHVSLVRLIASRVQANMPVDMNIENLIPAGMLGLVAAASQFNGTEEDLFPSYAKHRIRGAMLDAVRSGYESSVNPGEWHDQLLALNAFAGRLNCVSKEQEMCPMGMDLAPVTFS